MKITRHQLDGLIRYISKSVLNELSSMSSMSSNSNDPSSDTADGESQNVMTKAEKNKAEADQALSDKRELDMAKKEKDTEREKAAAFKSQYDQWRRYGKQNSEKAISHLAKKVASHGTITENIRKMRA